MVSRFWNSETDVSITVISESLTRLLDLLDELKRAFGTSEQARLEKLLAKLKRRRFADASSLIRFHEALLFICAYPPSLRVLRQVEQILDAFSRRVEFVLRSGEDVEAFAGTEVSGIVGTSLTAIFSYPIARWLTKRHGDEVSIDFDGYEDSARVGQTLPRFVPLLEEEYLVEANVPYLDWIRAARGKGARALPWLMQCFERLNISKREKAELYDSLQLYIHWKPSGSEVSRTRTRLKKRDLFFHEGPLVSRKDISLVKEMDSPPLRIEKLSRQDGVKLLGLIRDTSAIRYRELHGFTYGDPEHIIRADAGRGVVFFMNGVAASDRLPLRAYHSVFMVKNGVPIGYVEGLSLFERMEIGFNVYYTFREGESAWLYARVLRLFRQLLGITVISVDPYQIGYENEEGIESGAFWFYRKLGFRSVRASIAKLVHAEEKKIAARDKYRTSAAKLRQISEGHMLFEFSPEKSCRWDRFQVRNLGLAVAQRMGNRFSGDAPGMRKASINSVSRSLGVNVKRWSQEEQCAFGNLSLVLSLIPGLSRWTIDEQRTVVKIIRAKACAEESGYLHLMQSHSRLRNAIIELGSARVHPRIRPS